jgi:NADPH-dependent curcumin reductase CurA
MKGPANYMSLLVNRASMTGMVVFDYAARYGEAAKKMAEWMSQGKLIAREDVVAGGIDAFPRRSSSSSAARNSASWCSRSAPR